MGDKFSHLLTVMFKHIDRLTVLVFIIICATVLYLRFMVLPEGLEQPQPRKVWIGDILEELLPNAAYDSAEKFRNSPPSIKDAFDGKYSLLSEFDAFNLGRIRSQDQIDSAVNAGMRKAQQFFSQRQYDDCIKECDQVLRLDPGWVAASKLINECKAAQKAAGGN